LAEIARKSDPGIKIVLTGPQGLWDKNGKKANLVRELVIEEAEGDTNKILYQAITVLVDTAGNVFVGDFSSGQVKKFSHDGNYLLSIGRKGGGPGELRGPVYLRFNREGDLCIYDYGNQRFNRFSQDGKYLGSINLVSKNIPTGFIIDAADRIYLSYYDEALTAPKVIHQYNSEGKLLANFSDPVLFKEPMPFFNRTIKRNISIGALEFTNNEIYFSQRNPYEIRKFAANGQLLMRIFRNNSFMLPNVIKIVGKERYLYEMPVSSCFIKVWRGYIVNWVMIPMTNSRAGGSIVDLFDLNGNLLTSLAIPRQVLACSMDNKGGIYGLETDREGVKRVARYVLTL
jgi:hypothetical protein